MSVRYSEFDGLQLEAKMSAKKRVAQPDDFDGLESKLHKQIEEELKRRRWYFVHSRTDKKTTQNEGVPDYIIAAPPSEMDEHPSPRTFWIEVKRKGGKLSESQNITRHCLQAFEHRWAVIYSYEEFIEFIDQ